MIEPSRTQPAIEPASPAPAVRVEATPADVARRIYLRGTTFPTAIAWFGLRSFWGHLWHLAASVIATEDIDSRDWMRADGPDEFTRRVADQIGARDEGETLTDALGADLWIDFVSDTGDDATVSEEVARMIFERYAVDDPDAPGEATALPRGHLLIFGGDTAYPVATELEIHNRVIVPYNRVLRRAHDGRRRCLLGVAGNHDWYGGLDGFGRMFRARRGRVDRASAVETDAVDRLGQIGHFIEWIEAFTVGKLVMKRPALPLEGYTPVQSATYWSLRLAPALDLWGADRQLRAVDFQQRGFFADARAFDRAVALCIADPVQTYLERNPQGEEILEALDLSLDDDGLLILTGDTHHYTRVRMGTSTHVTAGGGGAFLHPTRILREGVLTPDAEFPGPNASRALALGIPIRVALGRAGFMVHIVFSIGYFCAFGAHASAAADPVAASIIALAAGSLSLGIAKIRPKKWPVAVLLSALTGGAVGFLPLGVAALVRHLARSFEVQLTVIYADAIVLVVTLVLATYAAGVFLMLLTLLAIRHDAFGALAHPGYKHFVRMRVRRDGSAIDAWVLGKVDPLRTDEPVVLVDRFTWQNPLHVASEAGAPVASETRPSVASSSG